MLNVEQAEDQKSPVEDTGDAGMLAETAGGRPHILHGRLMTGFFDDSAPCTHETTVVRPAKLRRQSIVDLPKALMLCSDQQSAILPASETGGNRKPDCQNL